MTIAAIATAPGEGGISIVRISGPDAVVIADSLFSGPVTTYPSHTVHLGKIIDEGRIVDQVLLVVMRAPRSFTGEDTVEIHCHGGNLVTRKVLELALRAGAKPAGPGEFSYRAFLNGKIDLAQAEAIQNLIGAKNTLSLQAATHQLDGRLSEEIRQVQERLIDCGAILEAWVDFPEEGLEFASKEEILTTLNNILQEMRALEATFHEGKKIHEGLKLALIGSPNAGKSSLMNALLGKDRAIVTHIPGTTRDLLEAEMLLGGLHLQLIDTAGIRETEEIIEREGIKRSRGAIEEADLVLMLIDASKPLGDEEQTLLHSVPKEKTLLVWNKIDLPHQTCALGFPHQVPISAKTKEGLLELKQKIEMLIWEGGLPSKDEVILTNIRHKTALMGASNDLATVIEGLQTDISPEFLTADLRSSLKQLSSIIGMDISEDILSAIFAKFCVGK